MKTRREKPALEVALLIFRESVKSFQSNSNIEISAALATYGFFAFLPLLFFLGYLFGNYAIFSKKVVHGIDHLIILMFPRTEQLITKDLYFFTSHKVAWAIVGLSLVLVSVMSLTETLRTSFGRIFRVAPEQSFLKTQLQNLKAALVMVLLFIGLLLGVVLYYHFLGNRFNRGRFFSETFPAFIGAALSLAVLYRTFLPRRLSLKQLLTAALLSAGLILVMREIFSVFINYNPGFGESFGSLKTLFIMILWVYYCFLVILFGAELMVNIGKKEALLLKNLFMGPGAFPPVSGRWIGRFIEEYAGGEVVFRQGERGERMFYIVSGSVRISGEGGLIRTMGPGEYFGEMSMLLSAPRTATVTATEPATRLVGLSKKNFELILQDNPQIVLSILKEMTRRLKDTSENNPSD
jgi:YihY family inner membrane protein